MRLKRGEFKDSKGVVHGNYSDGTPYVRGKPKNKSKLLIVLFGSKKKKRPRR